MFVILFFFFVNIGCHTCEIASGAFFFFFFFAINDS